LVWSTLIKSKIDFQGRMIINYLCLAVSPIRTFIIFFFHFFLFSEKVLGLVLILFLSERQIIDSGYDKYINDFFSFLLSQNTDSSLSDNDVMNHTCDSSVNFFSQINFPNNFWVNFCENYIFFMFSISPERFSLDTLLWFSPWEETSKLSEINSPKNTISNDSLSNHRLSYSFWFILMTHYNLFINAKKKLFSNFFDKNSGIFEFEFLDSKFWKILSIWIEKFLDLKFL